MKKTFILVPCSRHNIFATAACKRERIEKINEQEKKQYKQQNNFDIIKTV